MSLLRFSFRRKKKQSSSVAKERLQLIIARERFNNNYALDYMPSLQSELIKVISKYTRINSDDIRFNIEKQGSFEILEVKIEIPQI